MGYIVDYGYVDASGEYFLTIDTGKCDGCKRCVTDCQAGVLEIITDDYDAQVVAVKDKVRRELRYVCGSCKAAQRPNMPPCVSACLQGAISLSW